MDQIGQLKKELKKQANPKKAKIYQRFFKTGPGQYGEGDIFMGLTVPNQREIAKRYLDLSLNEIKRLLSSQIHEYRLVGLLILIEQFKKPNLKKQEQIFYFYLKNTKHINNWDLVDLSSYKIIGNFLLNKKDRKILYNFAKSNNLWKKRISIISTWEFIKNNQFNDCLKISKILLKDNHDLIHKAVGWMLREVGKRNQVIEEKFLKKYYHQMPRTMLRYAIERFSQQKRRFYLKNKVLK